MAVHKIKDIVRKKVERLSTGYYGLDVILGKTDGKYGLPLGALGILMGSKGVGKTRFAIALAKSMASKGINVLYFQNEMPLEEFANLIYEDQKCHEHFFCSDSSTVQSQLADIQSCQPKLVIVDSVNEIREFGNGTAKDIRDIIKGDESFEGYKPLAQRLKCFVLFLCQLNKDGTAKGSTALPHLVDIEIKAERIEEIPISAKMAWLLSGQPDINSLFLVSIGEKNRYGETGKWSLWQHNEDGVCLIAHSETSRLNDLYVDKLIKITRNDQWDMLYEKNKEPYFSLRDCSSIRKDEEFYDFPSSKNVQWALRRLKNSQNPVLGESEIRRYIRKGHL